MAAQSNSPTLETLSPKKLFTVSGSALAVWLITYCVTYLIPPHYVNPFLLRWVAFILSAGFAYVLLLRAGEFSLENAIVSVVNTFLIFIHASGFNAVAVNLGSPNPVNQSSGKSKNVITMNSSIFSIHDEIDWWPDIKMGNENNALKQENLELRREIKNLTIENASKVSTGSVDRLKKIETEAGLFKRYKDSADNLNKSLRQQLLGSEAQSESLKREMENCLNSQKGSINRQPIPDNKNDNVQRQISYQVKVDSDVTHTQRRYFFKKLRLVVTVGQNQIQNATLSYILVDKHIQAEKTVKYIFKRGNIESDRINLFLTQYLGEGRNTVNMDAHFAGTITDSMLHGYLEWYVLSEDNKQNIPVLINVDLSSHN